MVNEPGQFGSIVNIFALLDAVNSPPIAQYQRFRRDHFRALIKVSSFRARFSKLLTGFICLYQ